MADRPFLAIELPISPAASRARAGKPNGRAKRGRGRCAIPPASPGYRRARLSRKTRRFVISKVGAGMSFNPGPRGVGELRSAPIHNSPQTTSPEAGERVGRSSWRPPYSGFTPGGGGAGGIGLNGVTRPGCGD